MQAGRIFGALVGRMCRVWRDWLNRDQPLQSGAEFWRSCGERWGIEPIDLFCSHLGGVTLDRARRAAYSVRMGGSFHQLRRGCDDRCGGRRWHSVSVPALLLAAAALFSAIYIVMQKQLLQTYNALEVTTYSIWAEQFSCFLSELVCPMRFIRPRLA